MDRRTHQSPGSLRRYLLPAAAALTLLSGCATVPEQMQVERGTTPQNVDRDVRFRTTYYFRVFDYCEALEGTQEIIKPPFASDTLYRFRLTGKANSLTNKVHFESGTLTAGQIDPMGANVAFDEENGQYYFKSQSQVQREAEEARSWRELNQRIDRYEALRERFSGKRAADQTPSASEQAILDKLAALISQKEDAISGSPLLDTGANAGAMAQAAANAAAATPRGGDPASAAETATDAVREASVKSGLEQHCAQPKRGFQILGPEGWRTFNQNDRLVFAMTSSGRPLISTMRELAGRVLDSQPRQERMALPLLQADMRANQAGYQIQRMNADSPRELIRHLNQAIEALGGQPATGQGEGGTN